ncbi:DHBP synthase RibB-like alpha/beta domain-containing protein, partial [Syncephalis pseudoplumigaleata]
VGMPTETVYGLAANALDAAAVRRIFDAKGRPSDNPLIVHVSSIGMLEQIGIFARLELPLAVRRIIHHGWPGPLTLLLPRHPRLPTAVTCGRATVGVRFPAHPMARAMIAHAQLPLAAPSANTSGRPSPTRAEHVFTDLHGRIPLILDAGACAVGVESTVLDCTRRPPAILRPGGVTDAEVRAWGGAALAALQVYQRDFSDAQLEAAPTTPGMKYRHYSPTAPVILFECAAGTRQQMRQHVLAKAMDLYRQHTVDQHPIIGLLSVDDDGDDARRMATEYPFVRQYSLGASTRPDQVAHRLFDGLRTLDALPHVQWILVEGIPDEGQGIAVMNRLRKAAATIV